MRAVERKLFYLTTIPGLESVTHLELCEKWGRASAFFNLSPYPEVTFHRGGMEFEAPIAFGFAMNQWLRTVTRVLMRVSTFDAPNEKAFVAGLSQIPWSDFFAEKSFFDFKFASKSSKLSMSRQIQDCLSQELKKIGVKYKKGSTTIFIRMFRDQCSISLDTTGEAAFRRGESQKGSVASLRASTAQGLLRVLFQGIQQPVNLLDPMCGSGTFLKEAAAYGTSMHREFAYQKTPLGEQSQSLIKEMVPLLVRPERPVIGLFGLDNNEKAIAVAQKNLSKISSVPLTLACEDLFAPKTTEVPKDCVVAINPPWGKRLPGASQDILQAVWEKYEPKRIGLLMPSHWKINPIPMEKVRDLPILNSGVENRFLLFSR